MRKWIRRIPKGVRLTAVLALIALFVTGSWLLQGRPHFSAKGAFRQGLRDAAFSASVSPEARLQTEADQEWDGKVYYLGTDGDTAYGLKVFQRESSLLPFLHVWYPSRGIDIGRRTEDVYYFPARVGSSHFDDVYLFSLSDPSKYQADFEAFKTAAHLGKMDQILIKASGARVELSLVLEEAMVYWAEDRPRKAGVYALEGVPLGGGWFQFSFRSCYLPSADPGGGQNWSDYEALRDYLPNWTPSLEAAQAYYEWVRVFSEDRLDKEITQPAYFALTIYDETGAIAKIVVLEP